MRFPLPRPDTMGTRALSLLLLLPGAALASEPVFDVHVHLHDGARSLEAYEAQLQADGREAKGIGAMWFGGPNQALQGEPAATRAANDALLVLAAAHPKLLPIGTVHPYDGQEALDEVRRLAGRGVRVLKLHAHTQRFDPADPRVLSLVKVAGEAGLVVLMDNASILPGDSQKLFNLAIAAPGTRFVFAHAGGLDFRFWNTLALARTAEGVVADNMYFDISGTLLLAAGGPLEEEFVWTLRNIGIDRILLGSDYPQMSLDQALDALDRLDLDEADKAKIRYGNARTLFGL